MRPAQLQKIFTNLLYNTGKSVTIMTNESSYYSVPTNSGGGVMVSITKATAQERLADVPEEKRFWCHDGRYLKNLEELETALEQMTDETFSYHSSETKTDFSNWVRDVIGDDKLARDLLKSATPRQAARNVATRTRLLKTRAGIP
jgi:hypothetical protein